MPTRATSSWRAAATPSWSTGAATARPPRSATTRPSSAAAPRADAPGAPAAGGGGPSRRNEPWGPVWRLEVTSPRGKTSRRFLHLITADGANDPPRQVAPIAGNGLSGAVLDDAAILLAEDESGGDALLGGGVRSVAITALRPSARYRLQTGVAPGGCCSLSVTRSPDG